MSRINLFINRFLHLFEVRRVPCIGKEICLTFDDGPEENITEFVLDTLRQYQAKATFFCRGDNAEKHPDLLKAIVSDGHALGNHTYSHINSFNTPTNEYIADVGKADKLLHAHLFRPPWGSITLPAFIKLARKYKIVYWSLMSGDTNLDKFNLEDSMARLKKLTQPGDVVLFHCCHKHEKETRLLLPLYMKWLQEQGYTMEVMK